MKTFQIHFRHGGVVEIEANSLDFDGRLLVLHKDDGQSRMRDNDILSCHEKGFEPAYIVQDENGIYCLLDENDIVGGYCRNEEALQQLYDADGPQKPVIRR